MKKVILNLLIIVSLVFSMNVYCSAETLDVTEGENKEVISRVPPLPDRILFREFYVWARYKNDATGEEFISKKECCSAKYYDLTSSYQILYVRPDKRAVLDNQNFPGYTQVGYHIKIVYEIQGDDQFNLRKIVTHTPENIAPITFLPNGKYNFEWNTTMENPNLYWSGLFYRKTTYSSTFSGTVSFLDK
ncbi:MAG: hypothetical protein HFH58_16805 [Lachnospiraceae bacterium]|jgi:hypothetical protein|nr:hypothetical protein [Lachnospiraceae bacterium]